ncbi:MAG TPA: glycosyltransferase [Acidimicrobiia bacterium]|jgi:glycosyltransferase involved in cell wall biosynthesis|nr:glycosyltransferase [Acidimicrobiia bacterium]
MDPGGGDDSPTLARPDVPSDDTVRPLAGVTIAQVGHFDPDYSRNRIMVKALRRAGADVVVATHRGKYLRRTPRIVRDVVRKRADLILVGYPGHADVAAARLASLRHGLRPVVFDAFVSLYETEQDRRGQPGLTSARTWRFAWEDRLACQLATRVVLDTDTHLDYFADHFGVNRKRLRRVWVGADDDVMQPGPPPAEAPFRVFVYASFIPLHGLEHVVRAAHLLERANEDVLIDIAGSGVTFGATRQLATELGTANVRFLGPRPYNELPGLMASSHLCLGIFGTSAKAQRVIPNKVFDALATARPVLTADTAAAREVLVHGDNAYLCPPGDAEALAHAIAVLKVDGELRRGLAERGHALFRERFSIAALSTDVAALMLDALG